MSRVLLSALLLTSCAAEVPPRADVGDPRVMPVGAVAALDGSFSEGDGLTYAWTVTPEDGATLTEPTSPFATLVAEAPGFYTVRLEVCDAAGRCDVAETWARVDPPGSTGRISDWGIDTFAGVESGAGALGAGLEAWTPSKTWCEQCYKAAKGGTTTWQELCRSIPDSGSAERKKCWAVDNLPKEHERFCDARCAK